MRTMIKYGDANDVRHMAHGISTVKMKCNLKEYSKIQANSV